MNSIIRIFQKTADLTYRYPKSYLKKIKRFGGFNSYFKMQLAHQQMIKASKQLPKITSYNNGFKIYFLTGAKYIHQTLFCALSLSYVTKHQLQFVLIDDGTFDEKLISRVTEQMPNVQIVLTNEIEKNLNTKLPLAQFPYLRSKRLVYPHLKKLTDIHTINDGGFKLVLDSDMLFWNEPYELFKWLQNPNGCIHMIDCIESYGYDANLMENLCGHKIPRLMNVGAFGLNSAAINWHDIEQWGKTLETYGNSYFLEQALSAMIAANERQTVLSEIGYVVNPTSLTNLKQDKLHHYVDLSKKNYFEIGWQKIAYKK